MQENGHAVFSCGVGGVKVVANCCVQNKPKWNVSRKRPVLRGKRLVVVFAMKMESWAVFSQGSCHIRQRL